MANSAEQFADSTSALVQFARGRPLTLFFLLAYAWAWTFWLIAPRAVRWIDPGLDSDPLEIALFIVGAFGPTVGALTTRWLAHRDLKICSLWTGWRRFVIGLAVGLFSFFIAAVVMPALALVKAPLLTLHWAALAHWSTYGVNYSSFLGGPVNEEPGWRGFALPRLQQRHGPFLATVILAPLWAAWHLPMFLVEGWTTSTPWEFLLTLLGASFLLTAAANLSRFGVLVAILLHAFLNTSTGMVNALTHELPPRLYPQVSYAVALLVSGTALGLGTLAAWRIPRGRSSVEQLDPGL
jgi:membrane protease YdiL (CAAX protease family)